MYHNGIKNNVVTKLNPLTRNIGLDRHTDVQSETIIPHHYCVAGYKKKKIAGYKKKKKQKKA